MGGDDVRLAVPGRRYSPGMTDPRFWITALYAVGFVLPAWGVLGSYRYARTKSKELTAKLTRMEELISHESREREQPTPGDPERLYRIAEKYGAIREREGIPTETFGSALYTGLAAQENLWSATLSRVRGDLVWVGVGLIAAVAASIWSTWI